MRLLYRVFVVLVIALNGYLLASGVTALRRRVSVPQLSSTASPRRSIAAGAAPKDATIILERNAFDSITGPLHVAALSIPRMLPAPVDPLRAPLCAELAVLAVAQFQDPMASSATVRRAGESRGSVRRIGDRVGTGVVAYIGNNPLTRGPTVWVENGTRLCQAHLFSPREAPRPDQRPSTKAPARQRPRNGFPPELASRIRKLSPNLVQVDRSIVGALLEQYPRLTRGARVRLAREQGLPIGVQVRRIRRDGLLAQLGFKPRDRIERLDGALVKSLEAIRTQLSHAKTASQLRFQLTRNGRPMVIELAIR